MSGQALERDIVIRPAGAACEAFRAGSSVWQVRRC